MTFLWHKFKLKYWDKFELIER